MRTMGSAARRTTIQALHTYGVLLVVSFCLPSLTFRHRASLGHAQCSAVHQHAGDSTAVRPVPTLPQHAEPLADVDDDPDDPALALRADRAAAPQRSACAGAGPHAARPLDALILAPKLGPPLA